MRAASQQQGAQPTHMCDASMPLEPLDELVEVDEPPDELLVADMEASSAAIASPEEAPLVEPEPEDEEAASPEELEVELEVEPEPEVETDVDASVLAGGVEVSSPTQPEAPPTHVPMPATTIT